MSEHKVTLTWQRGETPFEYPKYPRDHTWKFDGGHDMMASAAPAYLGNPANTDPEEAFVAALSQPATCSRSSPSPAKRSSCSTNTLIMRSGTWRKTKMAKWPLAGGAAPELKFSGDKQPTEQELDEMHHFAHTECFIANSVKTKVTVEN